jgi:tRNA (guanine37-N1)-methyltransferase
MRIDVVTLFPALIQAVLPYGMVGRAIERKRLEVAVWNPRDYTLDTHRTVDARPYGGGPGMVLKFAPLAAALRAAQASAPPRAPALYLTPAGQRLTQAAVRRLAEQPRLVLVAGRYEGIDERVIACEIDAEWSIGDYVLSGGELPALVLIEALARLLPDVLGDAESAQQDSFEPWLDCPHYTRPELIEGLRVPEALLSGHHAQISRWRLKQALGRTWQRRPDLCATQTLTAEQQMLLAEFQRELSVEGDKYEYHSET